MKTFIVLGMHRSATSLTAKALHEQDNVAMGDELLGAGKGNEQGHFEDLDFLQMNMRLLQDAGGDWFNPPKEEKILSVSKMWEDDMRRMVHDHQKEHWGFKDPRTTLTIRAWMPYLDDPIFIAHVRNPQEVAESLNERDNIPISEGKRVGKEYNQRLLDFLSEYGGVVKSA